MANQTITKKENRSLERLLKELEEIKGYLKKFLSIIPEESLEDYENPSEIKKSYLKALSSFSATKK